ncbi:MAG TPA: TetR family transcriptional regulator [Candidatus Dormibacteraeota bacterium]|nr:TetR family transcriptional regulator [Candidatus Dormibacteraeota bacterium]
MPRVDQGKHRGLTRAAIVGRALKIGETEGLDAVSLRRLATEFRVTPMALYRHVRDKQDLINAMAERAMEGLDLTVGFRASMTWTDRVRRAMLNFKSQMDTRPLAMQLQIAYAGDNLSAFWRPIEDVLGILLSAGFKRRDAASLIRIVSNLLAGYVLLVGSPGPSAEQLGNITSRELLRKRFELGLLSLQRDQFPNTAASTRELADVWASAPDRWWPDTVDLLVFGLEAMLQTGHKGRRERGRP